MVRLQGVGTGNEGGPKAVAPQIRRRPSGGRLAWPPDCGMRLVALPAPFCHPPKSEGGGGVQGRPAPQIQCFTSPAALSLGCGICAPLWGPATPLHMPWGRRTRVAALPGLTSLHRPKPEENTTARIHGDLASTAQGDSAGDGAGSTGTHIKKKIAPLIHNAHRHHMTHRAQQVLDPLQNKPWAWHAARWGPARQT